MLAILFEHPLVCIGLVVAGAAMSESIRRIARKLTGGQFFGKKQAS
jgi:hypothetical protein